MPLKSLGHGLKTPQPPAAPDQMRGAVRFPLRLPVEVFFDGRRISAITEDISSTGVQFSCRQAIPTGTALHWEICLPAAIMGSTGDVTVDCSGRVMWSRPLAREHRAGVVIDSYSLKEKQG